MPRTGYQPPFVYFGGKSRIADRVWAALGNPANYVEPFAGTAAVLFLRDKPGPIETINDADGFIANVWRALQHDPDGVAAHADWIVSECDLHARHLWLVGQRESLTAKLCGDPDFFDAKIAGWWLWGINSWIAGGWCSGDGPWQSVDGEMVLRDNVWQGVRRKLPHLEVGRGVHRQLPHLRNTGQGVHRQRPHLRDAGRGACAERRAWLMDWFGRLQDRLRGVRICCGDWERVCGPTPTFTNGLTGVFLDPPYADTAGRASDIYAVDCQQVAHRVRDWAIAAGEHPLMRIVLAGYEGEHDMPRAWRVVEWQAHGGYGSQGDDGTAGRTNRTRERLWCSPACLDSGQQSLFT